MEAVCQSCGMPMRMDPQGGGTNADGTRNPEYCSHCYRDGTWMVEMSVDQMQERVGGLLLRAKVPDTIRKSVIAGIPMLRRWAK